MFHIEATIGFITKEYTMSHKGKHEARLVRTRRRQPDFVRKAGPMNTGERKLEREMDREFRDEVERYFGEQA